MGRLTIIEGNTNEKDNVRTFFIKAGKGDDGVSPIFKITKSNKIVTISVLDAEGEKSASVQDGFDPIVRTSKTGKVATVEIEDADGTHSFDINDGETYEVPTNSVIGWESDDAIPNGYEEVYNPNNYSTDEQIIGTWIDGKPLYRKVFETTLPSSSTRVITTGFDDKIIVRNLHGIACDITNKPFTRPIPYINTTTSGEHIGLFMASGSGDIHIKALGDNNNQQTFIYVEYTKTTD